MKDGKRLAIRFAFAAAAAVAMMQASAIAQPVDPSWFQGLQWSNIGPFRGGRVLAVAGVPGEAQHFYFGAVNGGVWETVGAERTWHPLFDGQPVASIGALALAPSNSKRIYVGTGEADMRSDIAQGDGMYRSDDGGKGWRHIGLTDSQQIGRIAVHPANPDLLLVAALGHRTERLPGPTLIAPHPVASSPSSRRFAPRPLRRRSD